MKIFIKGNVPSSKNSRQFNLKRRMSFKSKQCSKYDKETRNSWLEHITQFRILFDRLPKPVPVTFKFVRGTRHKFDYINPAQTIQDLMVEYGYILDDNADEIIPVFEPYEYDKENPGVYISIPSTL